MSRNDDVEVPVEAVYETEDALKCDAGLDDFVWVPKKLIRDDSEVREQGDSGILVIPEWFALEKGLI